MQKFSAIVFIKFIIICSILVSHNANASSSYSSFIYNVQGVGNDVVLIPGLMSDGRVWTETAAHLKNHYRVHTINLAGFGATPTQKINTMNKVKAELGDYISMLKNPIIIGHSLGGFLALSLAIDMPKSIDGVISVDGLPFIGPLFTFNSNTQVSDISRQANYMKSNYASFSNQQLRDEIIKGIDIQVTSVDDKKRVIEMSSMSDVNTISEMMYALMTTDLRPNLDKISAKVMLIGAVGAAPNESSKNHIESLYIDQLKSLPSAQIKINKSARHFVMLDDPHWLLENIDNFMRTHHEK